MPRIDKSNGVGKSVLWNICECYSMSFGREHHYMTTTATDGFLQGPVSIAILKSSGHYMYRTVVTICTASGNYMYRTVVTICTAQWSLYVSHSGHYMYRQW
jgi:hypothetical protein